MPEHPVGLHSPAPAVASPAVASGVVVAPSGDWVVGVSVALGFSQAARVISAIAKQRSDVIAGCMPHRAATSKCGRPSPGEPSAASNVVDGAARTQPRSIA